RRADGLPTLERHNARRFTTRTALSREAIVLDGARAGRSARLGIATSEAVSEATVSAGLGPDQAAALARLCGSGEAVVCLVGPAGTGKTRTVGAAAQAWKDSGIRVRGVAVSAVAAGVLSSEANVPAETMLMTLARF